MAEDRPLEFYVERFREGDDGWCIVARSAGELMIVDSELTQDDANRRAASLNAQKANDASS